MSRVRLDVGSLYHNAATWPLAGKLLSGCALAGLVLLVGDNVAVAETLQAAGLGTVIPILTDNAAAEAATVA